MNWTKIKGFAVKVLGPLRYATVRVAVAGAVIAYLQAMDVSIAQETVDKWLAFAALIVTALAGGNGHAPAKPEEVTK
jgi:hypothetical protein